MSRACDLIVSGGIFFLLLFTPLAFGAVHPWAFIVMESAIFVLIGAAMTKLIHLRRWPSTLGLWGGRLAIPFLLFSALICFQLLPIPPALLSWLSPNGYTLYQTTLPGWPEKPPFTDLLQAPAGAPMQAQLLPTPKQVRQGVTVPFDRQRVASVTTEQVANRNLISPLPSVWRPLSIAPALTVTDLVKFLAYGSLFFLIGFYPFGALQPAAAKSSATSQRAETRFLRSLFLVLLACGFVVALIGVSQKFTDNGKVLWFFIPYDWEHFSANLRERAAGPFINADHFANYLALIFPIALLYALKPPPWFAASIARALRILAGVTALVIFLAILLSLSRFGWCAALLVITLALGLAARAETSQPGNQLFRRHARAFAYTVTLLMSLLAVSVWVIGPQARQSIDLRLAESVRDDGGGLGSRVALWQDSLKMIRDFPMLGVGLGAWSDLFPRYQRPSASQTFYREAHNDYIQLLAETGLIGFMLLGWGLFQCARMVLGALNQVPAHLKTLLVACIAALTLMLLHELCDFSLRIPANAVLFTVLLGITVRLAAITQSRQRPVHRELKPWLPASVLAFAVGLIVVAFSQDLIPFPYNLRAPNSVAEAAERIAAHPAQAVGHVMLARLIAHRAPATRQTQLYATAAGLNPGEPDLRDMYASALLRAGQREPGLKEISQSVAMLPSLARHFYLNDRILPWLGADERAAIEAGFEQALGRGDFSALENFALYYERTGRPLAQAKLFSTAAASSTDRQKKLALTLKAAESLIAARQTTEAEQVLRHAIALAPSDARPYQALALSVYAPQGQRELVAAVIAEALVNTSQPFPLYLVLAESMQRAGATDEMKNALGQAQAYIDGAAARGEEPSALFLKLADSANKVGAVDNERLALEKAADLKPSAPEILNRLGKVYLRGGQHDRATHVLQRVTELRPQSADAFFHLAQAEEARYSYGAADTAYSRAAQLAPDPKWFQARHDEFKQKLSAARTANGKR